jgi:hypothetical protein
MKEAITTRKGKFLLAFLILIVIVAIPLVVWSFPSNPPLAKTGAPGESTCATCHSGGSGGGSIKVTASGKKNYHPGVKQHLIVTVTDPDPSAIFWGYEMTAVRASKPATGAGKFTATDKLSSVRKKGTKSYAAQLNDQQGKSQKVTYKIDWTPPTTNVGKITLYLAGIGGTGDPSADSVYAGSLTLSPK